jgi:hypothetical protein
MIPHHDDLNQPHHPHPAPDPQLKQSNGGSRLRPAAGFCICSGTRKLQRLAADGCACNGTHTASYDRLLCSSAVASATKAPPD